ncbi:hypothetical protein Tco_1579806, partial [Tanacetum coccineum]
MPATASPTDQSPGYILESDPEEDPEEDDEDPQEDQANYLADRDDDEEEEEEEPSRDDADDEEEDEEDEEDEEEEHPAPADSVLLPPVHRMTARISIRAEPSISLPPREEVERLLALTTPPPLLPIPAPISSPPVLLPSTNSRADRPKFCLPPRKKLCSTQGPRYEVGKSSSVAAARPTGGRRADYGFVDTMDTEIRRQRVEEVGYGIRDVWVDPREAVEEVALMTLGGVNTR